MDKKCNLNKFTFMSILDNKKKSNKLENQAHCSTKCFSPNIFFSFFFLFFFFIFYNLGRKHFSGPGEKSFGPHQFLFLSSFQLSTY